MIIGIDCLAVNPTYKGGINTYIFGLLDGFSQVSDDNHYVIFCSNDNHFIFDEINNYENFNKVIVPSYKSIINKLLLAPSITLSSVRLWYFVKNAYHYLSGINDVIETNCDILYTPTTVLNSYNLKIPTVLSMHDVQQYHYPEFFSRLQLRYRKLNFENSAKFADYFQASSEFIKQDLIKHFPCIEIEQVKVISEGVNIKEFIEHSIQSDILVQYGINQNDYLFFPAQLWKHKNHITILKSLKKLELAGLKINLILTGDKYSASKDIFDFIEKNNMDYVYYLGKVDFNTIRYLYKHAKFLITAVLYESSSLPVLEAAASGTPIIASSTKPNIEMSAYLKMNMFEPLDVHDCSAVIEQAWKMPENQRKAQIEKNKMNVKKYSWNKVAVSYLDFFKLILADIKRLGR